MIRSRFIAALTLTLVLPVITGMSGLPVGVFGAPQAEAVVYAGNINAQQWSNYNPYDGTWERSHGQPVLILIQIDAGQVRVFDNSDHNLPLRVYAYKVYTNNAVELFSSAPIYTGAHTGWSSFPVSIPSCGYIISVGLDGAAPPSPGGSGVGIASYINIGACPVAQPPVTNNATCSLLNSPGDVTVGQTFPVAVSMVNKGTSTWVRTAASATNGFKLGSQDPADNTTFGTRRIALPSNISPGGTATMQFSAVAPATAGTYTLSYQMVQEGVQWFGQKCTKTIRVNPAQTTAPVSSSSASTASVDDATCGLYTSAGTVNPGQAFSVQLTLNNTGNTAWSRVNINATEGYKLGSADPYDTSQFGIWRVELPAATVAASTATTFNFTATAPMTPGTYTMSYQMLYEHLHWFGQKCSKTIVVSPPASAPAATDTANCTLYTSNDSVAPGQVFPVSVSMNNTGNTTWNAVAYNSPSGYKLGSQDPNDSTVFNVYRVPLSSNIAPSGTANFSFNATAPTTPGTYVMSYQMVKEGVHWFGQKCTKSVTVTAGTNDATCGLFTTSADTVKPGQSFSVSLAMTNAGNTTWTPVPYNNQTGYKLGSADPYDTTLFGLSRVALVSGVSPNGTANFNFTVTAPSTPGTYLMSYRMLSEHVQWFGQKCSKVITVQDSAVCQGITAPDIVAPGETFAARVRMQNDGISTVWNPVDSASPVGYKLGSQNPPDNTTWGLSRVALPGSTPPGQTAEFIFNATAPYNTGDFTFAFQMINEGYDFFGALCSKTISVKPAPFTTLPGAVSALGLRNSTLFVGGRFTVFSNQARNNIAAVDASVGNLVGWNANMNAGGPRTIATGGSSVYVGGDFTTINALQRNGVASFDSTTSAVNPWNPDLGKGGTAYGLAVNHANDSAGTPSGAVYIGGSFATINGQSRINLGSVDQDYGFVNSWNTGPSFSAAGARAGSINTVATDGTAVYAGGSFINVGYQPGFVQRSYLEAFKTADATILSWNPVLNGQVTRLLLNGATLYFTGVYTQVNGQSRATAAVDKNTGATAAWNPQVLASAMIVNATAMYMGGTYVTAGGQSRSNLSAADLYTNTLQAWNPGANGEVRSVSAHGSVVYVGGDFSQLGGQSRNQLGAIDYAGSVLSGFNPDIGDVDRYINTVDASTDRNVFVGDNRHLYWYTY